jgi:hemerythrin
MLAAIPLAEIEKIYEPFIWAVTKHHIHGVTMIVWDNATMKTGVSIIDEQHKMLFQKFNEFSEAISGVTAGDTAGELLDFLQFYATWHFGQEENCMNEHKCPIAAENKKAHAEFLRTFNHFYTEWQTGIMTPKLVRKTHHELEMWLVKHVARTDTQLRSCVKGEVV